MLRELKSTCSLYFLLVFTLFHAHGNASIAFSRNPLLHPEPPKQVSRSLNSMPISLPYTYIYACLWIQCPSLSHTHTFKAWFITVGRFTCRLGSPFILAHCGPTGIDDRWVSLRKVGEYLLLGVCGFCLSRVVSSMKEIQLGFFLGDLDISPRSLFLVFNWVLVWFLLSLV